MATKRKIDNQYKIIEDTYAVIYLRKRDGSIYETLVDIEDLEKVLNFKYSWHVTWNIKTQSYYAVATCHLGINNRPRCKNMYLHRYILDIDDYIDVDHINHNTLDNRKSNLEVKNRADNSVNRYGLNKNNTSGYRNVCWDKRYNKWMVQLQIDGKNTVLGRFDDVDEAGEFAEKMRNQYYNLPK